LFRQLFENLDALYLVKLLLGFGLFSIFIGVLFSESKLADKANLCLNVAVFTFCAPFANESIKIGQVKLTTMHW